MPPRHWRFRVEDILGAISSSENYTGGLTFEQFRTDRKTVDAVVRNLEVIGEAAQHLLRSPASLPAEVPWTDIAGMRNILIHEYFGVDLQIIWQTVTADLPTVKTQLQHLLDQL